MTHTRSGQRDSFRGITVALALDGADAPDPRRFWLLREHSPEWDLIDIAEACRSAGVPLPFELRSTAFATSYRAWLFAVAALLARVGRSHATHPRPAPRPAEPEDEPRQWWKE